MFDVLLDVLAELPFLLVWILKQATAFPQSDVVFLISPSLFESCHLKLEQIVISFISDDIAKNNPRERLSSVATEYRKFHTDLDLAKY